LRTYLKKPRARRKLEERVSPDIPIPTTVIGMVTIFTVKATSQAPQLISNLLLSDLLISLDDIVDSTTVIPLINNPILKNLDHCQAS